MYNCWIAPSARELWPRLVCGFLRLLLRTLRSRAARRRSCLGDGLAEVFAGDGDLEGTAHGGLMNIFCGLSAVASLRPTMAFPKMPERILHSLKDFRFVARERADGLGIEADWRGGTQCPSNAIIRRDDVPKHFAYRANACGRTPGVFLSRPRRDRWSAVHRS